MHLFTLPTELFAGRWGTGTFTLLGSSYVRTGQLASSPAAVRRASEMRRGPLAPRCSGTWQKSWASTPAAVCGCLCLELASYLPWLAAHAAMLMQLAPGTLIRWPWGGRGLQRDHMGRIRVVPRLVAVPVDGPEAIHLTGVRQVPVAHSCTCCQPGRCGCWCNGHLALHALPFHPEANRASAGSARERPVSRRSWPVRTSSASHEHCLPPPCITASPPARL